MSGASISHRPAIAITLGDPCGVGPEVIVKALGTIRPFYDFLPVVIGNFKACRQAADFCRVSLNFLEVYRVEDIDRERSDVVWVLNVHPLNDDDIIPARPTANTASAVIKFIEYAVKLALSGKVQAVCTAPINKNVLARYGFKFPGHTEFLKFLTGSEDVVMMLAGPRLRVSLVTIHVPLSQVSKILSVDRICKVVKITGDSLSRFFGIGKPRIAVCGFNPHAGEEGMFGNEEIRIIEPAISRLEGYTSFDVAGPFPADTIFHRACSGEFDAVIAMYHDQGLIPVKLLHFRDAVNVTLGLPIIRTSVDHGTAYDIAGKGLANPGSMKAALKLALFMIKNNEANNEPC